MDNIYLIRVFSTIGYIKSSNLLISLDRLNTIIEYALMMKTVDKFIKKFNFIVMVIVAMLADYYNNGLIYEYELKVIF